MEAGDDLHVLTNGRFRPQFRRCWKRARGTTRLCKYQGAAALTLGPTPTTLGECCLLTTQCASMRSAGRQKRSHGAWWSAAVLQGGSAASTAATTALE